MGVTPPTGRAVRWVGTPAEHGMESNTTVLLDSCISAAIGGVNWRRFVRPSRLDYAELSALMEVVEAELARSRAAGGLT